VFWNLVVMAVSGLACLAGATYFFTQAAIGVGNWGVPLAAALIFTAQSAVLFYGTLLMARDAKIAERP